MYDQSPKHQLPEPAAVDELVEALRASQRVHLEVELIHSPAMKAVLDAVSADVCLYIEDSYKSAGLFDEQLAVMIATLGQQLISVSCAVDLPDTLATFIEQSSSGSFPKLKHLSLPGAVVGELGARSIARWLQLPGQSLESIDVSYNGWIGEEEGDDCSIALLADALRKPCCRLVELNLHGCPVSVGNGIMLVRSLRSNDTLQVLDLSLSQFADALSKEKGSGPALESLQLGLHCNCSIRELWIQMIHKTEYESDIMEYPGIMHAAHIIARQCLSIRYLGLGSAVEPGVEYPFLQSALSATTAGPHFHPFLWCGAANDYHQGATCGLAVTDPITAAWYPGWYLPVEGTQPGNVDHVQDYGRFGFGQQPAVESLWGDCGGESMAAAMKTGDERNCWAPKDEADPYGAPYEGSQNDLQELRRCIWMVRMATRDAIKGFFDEEAHGDGKTAVPLEAGLDGDEHHAAEHARIAAIESAMLRCTGFVETCLSVGDSISSKHLLMLAVLADILIECQEPSRVSFRLGAPPDGNCFCREEGMFSQARYTDQWELVPEKSIIPLIGTRLSAALRDVIQLAERNGLEFAAKLRKRWVKLVCLRGRERRDAVVRWRRAVRAHADVPLMHRAAWEGRPMELAKRLRLGRLAGGLGMRLGVKGPNMSPQLATPLEAARLGGHDECVRVLQEAMG